MFFFFPTVNENGVVIALPYLSGNTETGFIFPLTVLVDSVIFLPVGTISVFDTLT